MTLAQLLQKRNNMASEMRALAEERGENKWTDEQKTDWDARNQALEDIDAQIKVETDLQAADERSLNLQNNEERQLDDEQGDDEARQIQLITEYVAHGYNGMSQESRQLLKELRANTTTPDAKGGYTVPKLFRNRVVETMKQFGGLSNIATIMNTESGNPISWPQTNGTAELGEMVGETDKATDQDITFGNVQLGAKKASSKIIKISNELLTDTGIDILGLIARRCGQRIGRLEAQQLINGDGTGNNIKGLYKQAQVGYSAVKDSKLIWDSFLELKHGVDPAYRNGAQWLFNDSTLKGLKLMKDTLGRPIWLPDVAGKTPGTIDGDSYQIDPAMDDWGNGKKPVSYGDHTAVQIRRVNGMGLRRLDELYAESDMVAFLMFYRFDMVLEDLAAVKLLEIKAA
ncbi:phage major capsid protein [Vibrio sp. SCSIO 43136]|uniref:phage major capsid protein n=1 Tax=Vibrio sp. SCSIO 43136 TaxID=2819101 RepID=UPI002075EF8D|nr:phage major capsid protein [Vibrio sp. SCSIO 43136]USD68131.1 phage major capsid protein [Vibrio sp. SCSIO 43136]